MSLQFMLEYTLHFCFDFIVTFRIENLNKLVIKILRILLNYLTYALENALCMPIGYGSEQNIASSNTVILKCLFVRLTL